MITRKVAPALAAGCTVVVKPAEQTPLTRRWRWPAGQRAGDSAGRVQRRHRRCRVAIGGELTANPIVRKLTFTGSTEVGRLLMAQCAPTHQEAVARTRRQRALHRLRRRRPRRRGRGRAGLEVPQHRPDLRVRQPLLVQDGVYDAFAAKLAAAVAGS
jgi:succinate-semialdehyde dehydrogenase/glutarate-semialdehyde dehydrogenase